MTCGLVSVSYSWLGLHDFVEEGQFVWANSQVHAEFISWATGEPDDSGSSRDCGILRDTGVWFDDRCKAHLHPTVCEMRYNYTTMK